jgi:hypothetical protein
MSREEVTKIATDGLRYKSKKSGTPFGGSSAMGTMSCYKCGLHKPRSLGAFKRLLNQSMFVCGDCSPAKAWPHMSQEESLTHPSPRCDSCVYVMPSETSPTGLRCGHQYFLASPLMRKFTRMDHYPVVKEANACESWSNTTTWKRA